ncbi:MAG: TlpA family protein disulfide reductase [Chlorobiaceae bacterium]|jgi:thiol-disulfide isomerase/thioredoxin|nr:TlpA family protein disulfide reductase [Chlorobiaceae bacterium]
MNMIRTFLKFFSAALLLLVCNAGSLSAAAGSGQNLSAPGFSAVSLDGKPTGSSALAGKAYIINFFASWCPPCKAEIPDMVSLQNQYAKKGFTFVGIAVKESEPTIRKFVQQNRISYPVVMGNEEIVNAFSRYVDGGIRGIPTSFVVNSSGKITRIIVGAVNREDFEKIILEALGKPNSMKSSS